MRVPSDLGLVDQHYLDFNVVLEYMLRTLHIDLDTTPEERKLKKNILFATRRTGFADGASASVQFNCPYWVAVDGEGNVIVADYTNHRVRKITPDGTINKLTGSGSVGFVDDSGAAAHFHNHWGVAVDDEGNVIVTDQPDIYIYKYINITYSLDGEDICGS